MNTPIPILCALVIAGDAFASSSTSAQQLVDTAHFAAPVRLMAGDKLLGERRLYPSPVAHDMSGDGLADIVVGDLRGRLTVALRTPGDGPPTYAEETPLQDVDGKDIDFHNW